NSLHTISKSARLGGVSHVSHALPMRSKSASVSSRASRASAMAASPPLRQRHDLGALRDHHHKHPLVWTWWAVTDSNRRHPACKAGALPTELTARPSSLSPTVMPKQD